MFGPPRPPDELVGPRPPDPPSLRPRLDPLTGAGTYVATPEPVPETPYTQASYTQSHSGAVPPPSGLAAPPREPEPAVEADQPGTRLSGVPTFGGSRLDRLRAWLYVRCGLELKTVLALAVVLVVAAGLAFHHYWTGRPRTVPVPPPLAAPAPPRQAARAAPQELTVDVAGKVARPGLRKLPKGSRVADALTAAGGALPGANTTMLNLARPLTDGEQILVGVAPPAAGPAPLPGEPQAGAAPSTPLDLNTATAAQLDALPGVGPVLAQHIIDFRTQHGTFTSLQQLRQIPGIGDRKFSTIKPLVHP
ncbi:ComEA family DNA-binding protein [Streptomyces sp. KK5PA1]|uniref:ComEA family DNA-binding protein n=1 Tax=Actinacidiphila acididurans TaxID=2784346 RepID=A0ABS2TYY7_9ACTN|nr:ComEA family DNA-binding protein [Actinacidiphila acididurans]